MKKQLLLLPVIILGISACYSLSDSSCEPIPNSKCSSPAFPDFQKCRITTLEKRIALQRQTVELYSGQYKSGTADLAEVIKTNDALMLSCHLLALARLDSERAAESLSSDSFYLKRNELNADFAGRYLKNQKEFVKLLEEKFSSGTASQTDVLEAKVRLNSAELNGQRAEALRFSTSQTQPFENGFEFLMLNDK